jgi:hypothetical protein
MAAQLYPYLHPPAQCALASLGFAGPVAMLWDSIGRLPFHRHPAAALFLRVLNIPVGQPHSSLRQTTIRKF